MPKSCRMPGAMSERVTMPLRCVVADVIHPPGVAATPATTATIRRSGPDGDR